MATLTGKRTLLDLANIKNPDGTHAAIAEVLTKDQEMLLDMIWKEANDTFSERVVRRTSKPAGSYRQINSGVPNEKSSTKVILEGIAMLDSIAETDIELVHAAPNPSEFRMQESASFIEGMGDTLASTAIYGDASTDAQKFTGFRKRMADLVAGGRVLTNGGTTDLTSIYVINWGMDKVYMAYPKGSQVGLDHEDRDIDLVTDDDGNKFRAYVDYYSLKSGLVVKDDRCIGRSCNISTTDGGSSGLFDADVIIRLTNRMPKRGTGAALYMNEEIISQLEIQGKDKNNVFYGPDDIFGRDVLHFRSHPIRLVDAITNAEALVI